jgi:hypothetical protein
MEASVRLLGGEGLDVTASSCLGSLAKQPTNELDE